MFSGGPVYVIFRTVCILAEISRIRGKFSHTPTLWNELRVPSLLNVSYKLDSGSVRILEVFKWSVIRAHGPSIR